MKDRNAHSEELLDLLDRFFDGGLSDDEGARLDALLGESAEARRLYLEYADLNASLHWENVRTDAAMNRELVGMSEPAVAGSSTITWLRPMLAAAMLPLGCVPSNRGCPA